jgi:hypothetical protein
MGAEAAMGVVAVSEAHRAEGVRWRWRQVAAVAIAALGFALAAGPAEAALRFQKCGLGDFR